MESEPDDAASRQATGSIREVQPGWYSAWLMPSSATVLAKVLDPAVPYVVLESHYATPASWTRAAVPLDSVTPDSATVHLVRAVQFDIAMTLDEFMGLAARRDGGFLLWQTPRWPPPELQLRYKSGAARQSAFRGVGAGVTVQWPGEGDFASVASCDRDVLEAGVQRVLHT